MLAGWATRTLHLPISISILPPAVCGSIRMSRASFRTRTRPMHGFMGLAAAFSGKTTVSGASAVLTMSAACCAIVDLAAQGRPELPTTKALRATALTSEDFDRIEANSMLELEPPAHTRLRTLVNRAFVSRQVERLRARVETLAHLLIDTFEGRREADLLPAFASPLPITIIAEMLGVPVEMGPKLLEWSHDMVAMYMHGRTRETAERANRVARAFSDFIRSYAAERRKKPSDDLLSMLLSAQEDGQKLNEDELVSSTILLLNAGHEATVHQTGNAVRALLAQGGDPRRFFATR